MRHAGLGRWLDGRLFIAVLALEVLAALLLLVPRGEVASAGAALGEYAASLASGHGYGMQIPCAQLDRARRMPLEPLFLAAVSLLGGGLWSALVARLGLLLSLLVACVAWLAPPAGGTRWWRSPIWVGLLAALSAAPVFAKHLAQLSYEEGFSILLIPCLMLAGLGVVDTAPEATPRRPLASLTFGALLALVFLLKSGYAPLHLVGCAALVWAGVRWRARAAWIGLLVALAAPLGWGAFVLHATGRISLGTSWDGENLFRGWSDAGLRVYPWQSLDRLFDSRAIAIPEGTVLAPPAPPRCAFASEWAWSDHYHDRALAWGAAHPGRAALFMLEKARVVALEVRPVPSIGTGGNPGPSRALVVCVSFLVLRAAALLALWLGWRRRRLLARRVPSLVFVAGACAALSVPLLVGFAYDRHSAVLLVTFLFGAAGLLASATREEESSRTVSAP